VWLDLGGALHYFEDVAGTLLASPEGAREALSAAFSGITLRPVGRSYRLELEMGTAASVVQGGRRSAVSPVAGARSERQSRPAVSFVADIARGRGTSDPEKFVRVHPPRLAA